MSEQSESSQESDDYVVATMCALARRGWVPSVHLIEPGGCPVFRAEVYRPDELSDNDAVAFADGSSPAAALFGLTVEVNRLTRNDTHA